MVKATLSDKSLIVEILSRSFESNQSVNYIIPQDASKLLRIRRLMDYSFDVCYANGQVFLSEDRKACALVLLPDRKRTSFKSVYLDLKLILSCVGLSNLRKTLGREAKIKQIQSQELMYYLWFIGVDPQHQHEGIGSNLLKGVIQQGTLLKRSVFLETSTLKNLPWYQKFGFNIYHELDLGYKLFFLERPMVADKF